MAEPPDLTPDAHVAGLLAISEGDPDLVTLIGFIGAEAPEGYVRLYADPALTSWIDLNKDDIVRRDRLASEAGTLSGRSSVFVKGAAMRATVRYEPPDAPESEFLSASPDIQEIVRDLTLQDVAERATLADRTIMEFATFRTCKR